LTVLTLLLGPWPFAQPGAHGRSAEVRFHRLGIAEGAEWAGWMIAGEPSPNGFEWAARNPLDRIHQAICCAIGEQAQSAERFFAGVVDLIDDDFKALAELRRSLVSTSQDASHSRLIENPR
jgi:hypothetical protein